MGVLSRLFGHRTQATSVPAPQTASHQAFYRDVLTRRRIEQSIEAIPNDSAVKATELMRQLLVLAREENLAVMLFSGELSDAVYRPLANDLRSYLEARHDAAPDPRMRVLIETVPASSEFYDILVASRAAKVLPISPKAVPMPHFMLVGTKAYRLETDHTTFQATGLFNDPSQVVTLLLKERFESAWEAAAASA